MANNGFVKNFNLVNCYVDTSYYSEKENTIVTSKFSNEDVQVKEIQKYFVVVANQGFKLRPEFSFKLQPQVSWTYDENSPWLEITHEDFKPITNELNLDINVNKYDFQLAGVDLSKSLVYETKIKKRTFYLFLLGGFNEHKLIFALYSSSPNSIVNSGTYGDVDIVQKEFIASVENEVGEDDGDISILNDLMFTAESEKEIEPDINDSFFNTYYVDVKTLKEINQKNTVNDELIINTYSYPIKFNDEQLVETTIKTGYVSTEIMAKIFKNNYNSLDIFKFTVPDIANVTECYIKIPFNNDISLDYEDIKGKTIRGYITYEVLTNTTTLFITDEEKILYKNIITIGVEIPFKPAGELKGFKDPKTRLAFEEPKLYIKGVGKSIIKGNYLKGFMKAPNNILKDELDLLNTLLNGGVFINDENN